MERPRQPIQSPRIFFRGTALEASQIARIRGVIDERGNRSRVELARQVCREFGWQRPSGAWAVQATYQLLIRLERAGRIRLPKPRRTRPLPSRSELEKAAALLSPIRTPILACERSKLVVRPIGSEELLAWRAHVERFHYLGDGQLVGESLRYVAEVDGVWVALLSWGSAALRNGPRDRYVGWDDAARKTRLSLVVNNARFLVLPGVGLPHLASQVLAANLRRLSRDFEQTYGHPVLLAETFVDSSRFRGTCYRASNWILVGETRGWSKRGESYRFHGQPKAVWLYPLVRDFKKQLCITKEVGQRRGRKWMALDLEKLPLEGQGGLFEVLCGFTDPRKRRGVRHKIQSVLATAICAVMAGARSFAAMAEWAAEQPRETLKRLGSRRGKPPSDRTYRRVFREIDVAALDRQMGEWFATRKLQPGEALALDGKTSRGSRDGEKDAIQLLSAIVHGSGVVVAQVTVDSKTNEIPQVEPLLKDLALNGVVVTGDALHTQTKTARYLVEGKEAEYVFTVKDNQPTLKQDIETLGLEVFPPSAPDVR